MSITLSVIHKPAAGGPKQARALTLHKEDALVGRSESADVRLADDAISLVHLRILHRGGQLMALDTGSTNGSWLDGVRLVPDQPTPLKEGSRIAVGPFDLVIDSTSPLSRVDLPLSRVDLPLSLVDLPPLLADSPPLLAEVLLTLIAGIIAAVSAAGLVYLIRSI